MPVPRAAQNLQMPYPRDWNGGQMPRSSPWWGGGGGGGGGGAAGGGGGGGGGGGEGLGTAGIDWCITEDVGRRASTAYRMIKKKKKNLLNPIIRARFRHLLESLTGHFPSFAFGFCKSYLA